MPPHAGPTPDFTAADLVILAEFVCERYDALGEIENTVDTPQRKMDPEFRRGAAKARSEIRSVNAKLRPFYVKGK